MIESESKKLLRCEQRHACLFGCAVAFPLIALHARCDEIRRRAFTALGAGKDVIERQIFRVAMIAAVLAAITIANVNACTLHGRLATVTANVNVVSKTND